MAFEDLDIKQSAAANAAESARHELVGDAFDGQAYLNGGQSGMMATGDARPDSAQFGIWGTGTALYEGNQTLLQRQPNNWPAPLGISG